MKKTILLLMTMILFSCISTSQNGRYNTVKIKNPGQATETDSLLAIKSNGLILKTGKSIQDLLPEVKSYSGLTFEGLDLNTWTTNNSNSITDLLYFDTDNGLLKWYDRGTSDYRTLLNLTDANFVTKSELDDVINKTSKTLYINTNNGDNTIRPAVNGDVYADLDIAMQAIMTDNNGLGWQLVITDSETYTLTTDYLDFVTREINIYSDVYPVINQEAAYRFQSGFFRVKLGSKYNDTRSIVGSQYNFIYTNNASDVNRKIDFSTSEVSKQFYFDVDYSSVTQSVGLTYTPSTTLFLERSDVIIFDVDIISHNVIAYFIGGNNAYQAKNADGGYPEINIGTYLDNADFTGMSFDDLRTSLYKVNLKTYVNGTTQNKIPSNAGNSSTTYEIGNIDSPNGTVTFQSSAQANNLNVILTGGTLENTYFYSGHPVNTNFKVIGKNPNTRVVLNYTSTTIKPIFDIHARYDIANDEPDFQGYVKDLELIVLGGANVDDDIFRINAQAGTLNARVLIEDVDVYVRDGSTADIFNVAYSSDNVTPPLTIKGDNYYRINSGNHLIDYVSAVDPTAKNIVEVVGSINISGGASEEAGNICNDSRLKLWNNTDWSGWADYSDTQYTSVSPFALVANTDTDLPNNAGTVVDSQKPSDVTTFYDATSQTILGRNGDGISITVDFKAVPSVAADYIEIWVDITGGTGTPTNLANLYRRIVTFPKGAGVERPVNFTFTGYTLGTWEANGGKVKVISNGAVDIYDIRYVLTRTHKAR